MRFAGAACPAESNLVGTIGEVGKPASRVKLELFRLRDIDCPEEVLDLVARRAKIMSRQSAFRRQILNPSQLVAVCGRHMLFRAR